MINGIVASVVRSGVKVSAEDAILVVTDPVVNGYYLQDTFTEGNGGKLAFHTPDLGVSWTDKGAGSGSMVQTIESGFAKGDTVGSGDVLYAVQNVTTAGQRNYADLSLEIGYNTSSLNYGDVLAVGLIDNAAVPLGQSLNFKLTMVPGQLQTSLNYWADDDEQGSVSTQAGTILNVSPGTGDHIILITLTNGRQTITVTYDGNVLWTKNLSEPLFYATTVWYGIPNYSTNPVKVDYVNAWIGPRPVNRTVDYNGYRIVEVKYPSDELYLNSTYFGVINASSVQAGTYPTEYLNGEERRVTQTQSGFRIHYWRQPNFAAGDVIEIQRVLQSDYYAANNNPVWSTVTTINAANASTNYIQIVKQPSDPWLMTAERFYVISTEWNGGSPASQIPMDTTVDYYYRIRMTDAADDQFVYSPIFGFTYSNPAV